MTREEAIKTLHLIKFHAGRIGKEALDMALSDIRQQDVTDKYVGKMTNAQKIRAMSDEELAKIIEHELGCPATGDCEKMYRDCNACWLEWLQQPAEDDKA